MRSGLRFDHSLGGVCVLLEADGFAVPELPDVGDLGVEDAARGFVGGFVAARHEDGVAGVDEFFGDDVEVVPFGGEAVEDALADCGWAVVGVVVGVGKAFSFVPDEVGGEGSHDRGAVVGRECGVEILNDFEIGQGH